TVDDAGCADAVPTFGKGASIGRFLVLGSLGTGGMGVVLSAYDPDLHRKVAVKLIRGGTWSSEHGRGEALVRGAQVMARLQHPNVLSVYEVGFVDDTCYVVMEQVDGQTLRAWLAESARGWREVLAVLVQAGAGLAAAHRAGIAHRDVKPENVLLSD